MNQSPSRRHRQKPSIEKCQAEGGRPTRREVAAGTQCSARTTQRSSRSKAAYDANFQCACRHFFDICFSYFFRARIFLPARLAWSSLVLPLPDLAASASAAVTAPPARPCAGSGRAPGPAVGSRMWARAKHCRAPCWRRLVARPQPIMTTTALPKPRPPTSAPRTSTSRGHVCSWTRPVHTCKISCQGRVEPIPPGGPIATKTKVLTSEVQAPHQLVTPQGLAVDVLSRDQAHGWLGCMSSTQQSHTRDVDFHIQAACRTFYANIRSLCDKFPRSGEPRPGAEREPGLACKQPPTAKGGLCTQNLPPRGGANL